MIVISNSSPIITLAAIGQLDILAQVYQHIIIPKAVYHELTLYQGRPGSKEVQTVSWITQQSIVDLSLRTKLLHDLDIGESEAIALALETQTDVLLMDEQRGRRIATNMGISVTGILGTLIAAKKQGIIPLIKPVLDDLIYYAGFRVHQKLYKHLLQIVGE